MVIEHKMKPVPPWKNWNALVNPAMWSWRPCCLFCGVRAICSAFGSARSYKLLKIMLSAFNPGNVPSLNIVRVPGTEADLTGTTFPSFYQCNMVNTKCTATNMFNYWYWHKIINHNQNKAGKDKECWKTNSALLCSTFTSCLIYFV